VRGEDLNDLVSLNDCQWQLLSLNTICNTWQWRSISQFSEIGHRAGWQTGSVVSKSHTASFFRVASITLTTAHLRLEPAAMCRCVIQRVSAEG
jgi:hypothetical protein